MRDNDTMFYLLYADIIGTSEDQMILQVLADAAVPNVHPMLGYALFFFGLLATAGFIKWITGSMEKS